MKEFEKVSIRSEEVQEIISHVPHGLIRWGVTVIFIVIVSLLSITWFIKYPDLLTAKVIITTNPAPVNLVSRTNGKITLVKGDNQLCYGGEIIAYIQSNADIDVVLALEKDLIINSQNITLSGSLGDLQPYYSSWLKAQSAIFLFHQIEAFNKQIVQLNRQLVTYKKLNQSLLGQQQITKQELQLALEKFKTDSILYVQKVTAAMDYNQSKTIWLQQQRISKANETTLLTNELQINQLQKQITDIEIQKIEQQQSLQLNAVNTRDELLSQVARWKETFLITASGPGRIGYLGFLENNTFVDANRPLFSIIPDNGTLIARAELPIFGSGKVKTGQAVNIRLESYPFEQFGLINGSITSISEMSNEGKYYVNIEIANPLLTSQHKTLAFKQQLTGTTEIITEDLRLLERFFYQLRSLLKRTA
jgi:HlyD family secretion protein